MLIQICFMCVSLKFQSVRCKVNMSIAHLNFNFYPKKLILWQVMFILCSSPPATTLWFCYWQRYSSFLSDSIYEKWIVGLNAAGHTFSFHFVEVNFAGVPNVNDRDRLYWIGTNFDLSDEDVDFLILLLTRLYANLQTSRISWRKTGRLWRERGEACAELLIIIALEKCSGRQIKNKGKGDGG